MDEDFFAQSREPDDLFADEIEYTDVEPSNTATAQPSQTAAQKPRNSKQQTGSRRGNHGSRAHAYPPKQEPPQPLATASSAGDEPSTSPSGQPTAAIDEPRHTSVRGDRSATGPAKPQKRTEAELTELMASMQLKNAAKTAAFARAEKDQESFLRREQQEAAKRVEERKSIREQDAERAKNRERKIKAQGGREWDSEKVESDIVDRRGGRSSGFMRGAYGGVAGQRGGGGLDTSRYAGQEEDERDGDFNSGSGRGGYRGRQGDGGPRARGGRGGRGPRGRGGISNDVSQPPANAPNDSDFPSLPAKAKAVEPAAAKSKTLEKPKLGGLGGSTWAEEMATPIEDK